jgi:hypothetical protein
VPLRLHDDPQRERAHRKRMLHAAAQLFPATTHYFAP